MKQSGILKNKLFLYLTEFFAGMSVMAVELGASRLLAPYFSSSQIVWTIIIGTIMIAMALSCNPSLLICDEPTTALDVTIQAQILKLINKMKKELNTAVLLITHDMGVISEMADNVIVMYAGKIVEYTNVEDLFKNPLHPYTIGLRRSIPDIDSDDQEELEVIPGSVPMLYELPKGCFFAPRCKHAKEICHQECPAMMEHGENHLVRCWKYHERWNKEDVENGK